VRIFENIRIVTLLLDSKGIQLFEIFKHLSLLHNAVFGNYNGDYGRQKRNKLLPSLAPIDAVFGSYSRQNGDYSQLPFWVTTVAQIVAVSDDYSSRKWRKNCRLENGKNYSIRLEMENHYWHSTGAHVVNR